MSPRLTFSEKTLASSHSARVLRIDCAHFATEPLFLKQANTAENQIAQALGEARLKRPLTPVPPAAARIETPVTRDLPGIGEVTLLAERSLLAGTSAQPMAPLHLLRLASGAIAPDQLLINANYFLFVPPELENPWNAYGDPIGLTLANGIIETPPTLPRTCLFTGADGHWIDAPGFADCEITLPDGTIVASHPLGAPTAKTTPIAFAAFHGAVAGCTPRTGSAEEIAYVGRYPVATKSGGGMPIPTAGCVIRLKTREEIARLADSRPITYRLPRAAQHGVQAGPLIVREGCPLPDDQDIFTIESMTDHAALPDKSQVSPLGWAANWHHTRAARLAAGLTAEGALFLCAVEGTSSFLKSDGAARGATLHDLACLMAEEGAEKALHLDGGGSTQVFANGGGALLQPRDIHHAMQDSPAQFDRPLPLCLRLS